MQALAFERRFDPIFTDGAFFLTLRDPLGPGAPLGGSAAFLFSVGPARPPPLGVPGTMW